MTGSKPMIKIIDLFSGAGGLSNGFEQTGRFEVVGAVEINEAAANTYIKNHGNNSNIILKPEGKGKSDITKIDFQKFLRSRELNGAEMVVIGGPPCQGFSNANRQKNYLISGNNQLVKEFVKVIDQIRPTAFLLENVKTMGSSTHKFFVTENSSEAKFKYGCEEHLNQIREFEGRETIFKDDTITLIETENKVLQPIIKKAIEFGYSNPIITNSTLISRLRSIERRFNKSGMIKLNKINEIKETEDIIKILEAFCDQIKDPNSSIYWSAEYGLSDTVDEAKRSLVDIQSREIESYIVKEKLGPIIDLDKFLLLYKELLNEKIVYNNLETINEPKIFKVRANVKSYNVVDYLRSVFNYLGYTTDDGVLTASHFGVPQRRNRFMILGVKTENLKVGKIVQLPKKIIEEEHTTRHAIQDLQEIMPQQEMDSYKPIPYKEEIGLTPLQRYYRKDNEKIFNHINTKSKDLSIKRFKAIKEGGGKNFHSLSDDLKDSYTNIGRTQNTVYLRLNYDEPSPTVVNVRKSMWNHPENAVALSIREAARLQSFRDNFVFYGTKDQQYQQVGNAVPPLMARAVAEKILDLLGVEGPEYYLKEEVLGLEFEKIGN